ncbi:MAG: polysaccharide deacetylase family protein [Ignavibacteriaceae bacterium]
MLSKVFYLIKPLIPRKFQLYMRRRLIFSKLLRYKDIWPILKGSEKPPAYFTGWQNDKKFTFVLTHDVEHQGGYDKVLKLMEVEKELGFVSSFYFVPERDYKVRKELLKTLKENGFEYGLHGLHHDGKLFSSEEEFLRRAKKINQYLKDWETSGFRAPAMHHNLDWIGELDIKYDLSTFDTDPFEPQPDGVGTIFPFWVENPRHKNNGYVELPYTLPQDFTAFILMREKSIKIWQNKADWIIKNNGMVLVNSHPDYINFNGNFLTEEFSISLYKSFLVYIRDNYSGQFWNPLPRELADYIRKNNKKIRPDN